jgi:hypothetical protein
MQAISWVCSACRCLSCLIAFRWSGHAKGLTRKYVRRPTRNALATAFCRVRMDYLQDSGPPIATAAPIPFSPSDFAIVFYLSLFPIITERLGSGSAR